VLEAEIVPALIDLDEGYFVAEVRLPLTSRAVRIPGPAFNGQIYTLFWRSGADAPRQEMRLIQRAELDDEGRSDGLPRAFYFQGNSIRIVGDPQGLIDIAFPFRPGKLVTEDSWRTITNIDTTDPDAPIVTLDQTVPSDWSTSTRFDIQSRLPGHEVLYWELSASAVAANQITFTSEISGTAFGRTPVEVGDVIVLTGKAAYPAIPEPLHSILAQGAAARIATTQSDGDAFQLMKSEFARNLRMALENLDRRYEGRVIVVNRASRFRRHGFYRWRGGEF